jgi:hypothetical protein
MLLVRIPRRRRTMGSKLKMLAVVAVAACAIGVAGLVGTPAASAAPRYSCAVATALANTYLICADVNSDAGLDVIANFYRGKAVGLTEAAC